MRRNEVRCEDTRLGRGGEGTEMRQGPFLNPFRSLYGPFR